jgi:hypothetical protein
MTDCVLVVGKDGEGQNRRSRMHPVQIWHELQPGSARKNQLDYDTVKPVFGQLPRIAA